MRRSFRLCAFRRFTPLLVGLLCAATATPASAQVTDDELQRHVATLLSMARSGFAEVRGARIKSQPSSRDSIVEFKSRYAIGNDNSVVLRRGSAQKNIWYTQHHTRDVDLISDLRLRRPDMRMLEVADSAIAPVIPKGWIRNVRHMQRDIEWKECSGRRGHWVGIYSSSAFSFGLKVGVWDKPCPRGTTQARGAGLSAAQRQYGSIHQAAPQGSVEGVRAFLDAGIAVDARNSAGSTALHIAVAEGHGGIVRLLLRHGMDVDVEAEATKSTPLHVAAARGKAEMARTLIDQGADVNARDYYNSTPLHDLARHNWAIDYRPTARLLLSRGANVNARNDAGETPLRVVQRRDSERAKAVAQLLLQHGGRE